MSDAKVPPEFEWIKPGVKYYNKKAITKGEIKKSPIWNRIFGCWEAETNNGLSVFCQSIAPLSQMPITLTLTREQAEDVFDYLCRDSYLNGSKATVDEVKKQIEEKLNGL